MKNAFSMFVCFFFVKGVFDVDPDEVKTVIEGDSLNLQTDFIETQKDGLTEWKFNDNSIATINRATGKVEYSDVKLMTMFSDKINLDQTGFLTIWNIRIQHSGVYKVESISSVGIKSKTFKVIVKESPLKSVEDKDEIKALLATKGNSETLHTDTDLQKHDLILWRFGAEGSLIAKGDADNNRTLYYDGDDGRFRDRLKMDSRTGSLTISDIETEHAGEFRLKIISDRRILLKRFTVTVSVPSISPGAIVGIVLLVAAAAAAAAGVGIYCRRSNSELKKLMSEISKQLEQLSKLSKQLSEINEKELAEGCDKELSKISEKLKEMSGNCEKEMSEISKQLEQLHEEKISERLSEIADKIKKICEEKKPEQPEQLPLTGEAETSEPETHADVTKVETTGSELEKDEMEISEQEICADVTQMEKGEGERCIYVAETAISRVMGDDRTVIDRKGRRSLVIRNLSTKRAGGHTHDGKDPENDLKELKEEPSGKEASTISQTDEDGENEQ
ncbi:uncharacterized protein LOC125246742 isoform X2 [Megalobrama amblycephala]|uniref:uncharacterized protein LOC125246742 isoform X2 n=1 Tax=Megalobrama amblycephala TaxID=75352 RepID=UPI002013DE6F|nr:uncharacterized protein LOC125246742 isoform X2 [Megalobrama amblycephala]